MGKVFTGQETQTHLLLFPDRGLFPHQGNTGMGPLVSQVLWVYHMPLECRVLSWLHL